MVRSKIDPYLMSDEVQVTRWSLDPTSYGAYSIAEPGDWLNHELLGEPVENIPRKEWLFFAGEGTARGIYLGSYPGAYESGVKAARDIHAELLKRDENKKKATQEKQ